MQSSLVGLLLLPLCVSATFSHRVSILATDSCTCLPWQQTYASGSATSGDAFEFGMECVWRFSQGDHHVDNPNAHFPSSAQDWMSHSCKTNPDSQNAEHVSSNLFLKMSGGSNACIKVASTNADTEWYGKSWCYVSSECKDLNGGVQIPNKPVSAKLCTEDEDEVLSEKSPTELLQWMNAEGLSDADLVARLAYPYMGEDFGVLADNHVLKEAIKVNASFLTDSLNDRLKTLKGLRAKEKPAVYALGNDLSTKYVVYGQQTWTFDSNPKCLDGCPKDAEGSCKCTNWKEAYATIGFGCGAHFDAAPEVLQLPFFGRTVMKNGQWMRFCQEFLYLLDDKCMNQDVGDFHGQFCIVDSSCSSLNGGSKVGKMSWKKCKRAEDNMLAEYSPEGLAELAKATNQDFHVLHKMSYPVSTLHMWKEVSGFWNVSLSSLSSLPQIQSLFESPEALQNFITPKWGKYDSIESPKALQEFLAPLWGDGTISPELSLELQSIKDSGNPYSFPTSSDDTLMQQTGAKEFPHVIVEGDKVYLSFGSLVCVSGC